MATLKKELKSVLETAKKSASVDTTVVKEKWKMPGLKWSTGKSQVFFP